VGYRLGTDLVAALASGTSRLATDNGSQPRRLVNAAVNQHTSDTSTASTVAITCNDE